MRSWLVGMPGELVSCVGCHENRRETLPTRRSLAHERPPEPLEPWYGAPRPFAFAHEVFPVLEKYCVGCHDAAPVVGPRSKPSFKNPDVAYDTLHPYVHRPGVEADMALLYPMEYHASTSLLIQMLEKGHHGVKLAEMSREARERLYCWIDLNVPRAGSWNPPGVPRLRSTAAPPRTGRGVRQQRRRSGRRVRGGGRGVPQPNARPSSSLRRRKQPVQPDGLKAAGFPIVGRGSEPAATGQSRGSTASHRLGRRRQDDPGLDSRRRVRDGRPRRRPGRAASLRGAREPALSGWRPPK